MAYADAVLTDSPLAYYRLGEASGTVVSDSSGNGHHATYSGVTLDQTGATADGDGGVRFIGFDTLSKITLPATIQIPAHSAVSIEFFFKVPLADIGNSTLFNLGGSSSVRLSAHVPWSDQNLYFDFGGTSGNSRVSASIAAYLDNAWHHCVLTNANGFRRIYIDGTQITGPSGAYDLAAALTGGKIGHCPEITDTYWKGSLDEFAVYTHELSAARVAAHYAARTETTSSRSVSASVTDGTDTVTGVASVRVSLSAGVTDAQDTASGSAGVVASASGAVTDGADLAVSAAGVLVSMSGAAADGADTARATVGQPTSTIVADITDTPDTVTGTAAVLIALSGVVTDAPDTISATGAVGIALSASVTDGADIARATLVNGAVRIVAHMSVSGHKVYTLVPAGARPHMLASAGQKPYTLATTGQQVID